MEKRWYVLSLGTKCYKTYDEAEGAAKRYTASRCGAGNEEYVVAEAVAQTKAPVPEIEVVKVQ